MESGSGTHVSSLPGQALVRTFLTGGGLERRGCRHLAAFAGSLAGERDEESFWGDEAALGGKQQPSEGYSV